MNQRELLLTAPSPLCAYSGLRAQVFPSKPTRYIVPVAAGDGSDFIARTVTERWSKLARDRNIQLDS